MTLTAAERVYDYAVTEVRLSVETTIWSLGYSVGLMEDYLTPDFIAKVEDSIPTDSGVYSTAGVFESARDEGESVRQNHGEHTAEDLFVWAYEWMMNGDMEVLP